MSELRKVNDLLAEAEDTRQTTIERDKYLEQVLNVVRASKRRTPLVAAIVEYTWALVATTPFDTIEDMDCDAAWMARNYGRMLGQLGPSGVASVARHVGSRVLGEQLCALYAVIEYAGKTPPNKRGKPWRDALVRSLKKLISSEGFWFDPVCHEALDALCALGIDAAPLAKTVACGLGYTLTNQKVALALVSMGPAGHRVLFEGFFACKALRGPWSDASWRSKAPAFELAPFMPMTLAPDLARVAQEKSGKRVYALSALGHLIHQAVTEEDLQVVSELPPRVVAAARRHHSSVG